LPHRLEVVYHTKYHLRPTLYHPQHHHDRKMKKQKVTLTLDAALLAASRAAARLEHRSLSQKISLLVERDVAANPAPVRKAKRKEAA
jgi:hypothetical protein